MTSIGERFVKAGGLLNFLIALFHIRRNLRGRACVSVTSAQVSKWQVGLEKGFCIPCHDYVLPRYLVRGLRFYAFSGAKAFRKLPFWFLL